MAATITPSLRASLERLKHAGAVNGLCLAWRRQVLVNLLPFEDFRCERIIHSLQDAREHFGKDGKRDIRTFWFGYDGVYLLALFHGECSLIALHSRASDADFLSKAGFTFLEDSQLLVNAALNSSGTDTEAEETQPLDADAMVAPGEPGMTHVIPRS